jgi:hypothetical protein
MKKLIDDCKCHWCRTERRLKNSGARFDPSSGRGCELVAVAAAPNGLTAPEVVEQRRALAKHRHVTLTGPISNSPRPVHIRWALNNSNLNPRTRNRINLGTARAVFAGGRYFLEFDPDAVATLEKWEPERVTTRRGLPWGRSGVGWGRPILRRTT